MLRCILWIPLIFLMLPLKYLAQKFPVSLPVYNTAPVPTPPTDQSHQLLPAADPEDSDQGRVAPDREHHAAVPGQLAQLGGGEGGDTGHS